MVIDAGSTGSRIHAFKFEVEGEELTLLDSTFKAIEPGLSSFNEDPAQAGLSLVPLLDEAKAFVPAEIAGETTVELRATAGLRMLDPSEVQSILQEVHTVLQSYPFKVLDDAVSVMDGADEGVFMWVTSNYYLGNIGKPAGGDRLCDRPRRGLCTARLRSRRGPAGPSHARGGLREDHRRGEDGATRFTCTATSATASRRPG